MSLSPYSIGAKQSLLFFLFHSLALQHIYIECTKRKVKSKVSIWEVRLDPVEGRGPEQRKVSDNKQMKNISYLSFPPT